ncbi:hypothetical protein EJ03DRAFT_12431 [Teratosphaeria nubilosa]|uniref:Uncharacterized protein n=1 Tax=Teratosphaeria nubilosa TaxID=161662 RepID=A0A6G1LGA6_9PEZI|nr:hypothetical protein EJ03DRAFT_12431 [Teratosphaeria nubilosa]
MSTPSTNPDSTQGNASTNDATSSAPSSSEAQAPRSVPNYTNQNYSRTVPVDDLKAQIAYAAAHQYLRGNQERGAELEGMRRHLFKQGTGVLITMRRDPAAEAQGLQAVTDARDHLNQLVQDGSFSASTKYEGFEDPAATKAIDVRDFRKLLLFAHAHLQIQKKPDSPPDIEPAIGLMLDSGKAEFAKDSQHPYGTTAGMGDFIRASIEVEPVIKGL